MYKNVNNSLRKNSCPGKGMVKKNCEEVKELEKSGKVDQLYQTIREFPKTEVVLEQSGKG